MKFKEVPVEDFCSTGTGGTPSRSKASVYYGGSIPWVKSGELKEEVITETAEHITNLALEESSAKIIPSGAILVAMYGATVGRVAILGIEAATNQAVCFIIPKEDRADRQYLFHALRSKVPELLGKRVGGAQPNISQRIIRETLIPLPSLTEQRRIAAILDKADAIRRKRQEALYTLQKVPGSVFYCLFGDPNSNPNGWSTVTLGEVIEDGPQNGLYRPANDYGSGTPILRIDSFYSGYVTGLARLKRVNLDQATISKYKLNENDIVINRVNSKEFLGKSALIVGLRETTVFESNMMRFSVDQTSVTPRYLVDLLGHSFVKRQILKRAKDAVNQSSINQEDVRSLEIRLPPLDLQRRYVEAVSRAEIQSGLMKQASTEAGNLFNSLSNRAFEGEL